MARHQVVYLTGAPASGKSTLCANIEAARPDVKIFSYSKELRSHVSRRGGVGPISEEKIRNQSARLVTRADIAAVDGKLTEFLSAYRGKQHVIIDSHAVTKEHYGFRVTPFSEAELQQVAPTLIAVLFASADETRARIMADGQGRPTPTAFQADFHTHLQASLACAYAFRLGCAIYYLDATLDRERLAGEVCRWLDRD